ncbi:class I SAM-dependent methyltransferase [Plantactinospora sp. GCM10030261]|uniref:class I SAM-dependent methyltransferase n=1 Tax=Plantactinospora sp. GCM10030261 TaxID=3273420 RepID=UPI00360E9984
MTEPWMIDELAFAGPEHLDAGYVAGYDRKSGSDPVDDDLAVLRTHGMPASATVLDLGAGTGRFALAAARQVARVVAVDVSPAMLAHVAGAAARDRLTNVECVRAGFLSYAHTGAPADVVYTRHALHQVPDFFKAVALHRIARSLRPGGLLRIRDLIFDVAPDGVVPLVDRWLAGAADDPAAGYTRDDYVTHLRTEFSTYRWLFEPMLDAAGFDILDVSYAADIYGAYTCRRR